MKQFDTGLPLCHKGVVNAITDEYCAHGNNTVSQSFCGGNDIGSDAETVGGKIGPNAAKAGDHFIKN